MLFKIAGAVLEELAQYLFGLLPWPEVDIVVPAWVYLSIFGLLMIALVWGRVSEFRVQQREAIAKGRGRQHLWANAIFVVLVVCGGLWFAFQ